MTKAFITYRIRSGCLWIVVSILLRSFFSSAGFSSSSGLIATRLVSVDQPMVAMFGLSASICTKDLGRALEYVQRAEAGVIMVNLPSAGIEYQIPFGGVKDSSSGPREQGPAAVEFYTETKVVYIDYTGAKREGKLY